MDFEAFLDELRRSPDYRNQLVHKYVEPPRSARFGTPREPLSPAVAAWLAAAGIDRLYTHQAEAVDLLRSGRDVVVATGTASGKSLCYLVALLDMLAADDEGTALLLFPTKALCQDQFAAAGRALAAAGLGRVSAGVLDGDTPSPVRRKLRDTGRVIFSNPDMVHAAIMPQHGRYARFLSRLRLLVVDELHVYTGFFGSNMAHLLRRLRRVLDHYAAAPQFVACSATIANPGALATALTGREVAVVTADGSPRGRRTWVFCNPPRVRAGNWRSRRSANVEAHELMAELLAHGVPTITFSKARMTAEMIFRYVRERLQERGEGLAGRVTAYRGGYLPEERREIERRLFSGELSGVSTTPALELGIDVGGLDASILVGYPGTLASFVQQAGRAGRRERDSLVVLIGLDTPANQYVMSNPDYLFARPVEEAVIDPDNPFVALGHVRCATHELPVENSELATFGPYTRLLLHLLQENHKVRERADRWYYNAAEVPQHELSLRDSAGANVILQDVATGEALGEVGILDAPALVHPDAIYMQFGDTWRVRELDLDRNVAYLERVEVDYYTQPLGGTDVHHIDNCLREKPFGTGNVYWGEVTAYFRTVAYEKIHFYSLDAISRHGLDLPTFPLDTMAFWLVPPEELMAEVRRRGLEPFNGLRGIGYATRMILPLFVTCDTLDFSHSVGSANSPWQAIFIYERYQHGLGFTRTAYDRLHEILPAVRRRIRECPCTDGCPCCVGKPLRQFTTWNVERGEGSIPSKAAALLILDGWLGEGTALETADREVLAATATGGDERLHRALKRRLERQREPQVLHRIRPDVPTAYPEPETDAQLDRSDADRRRGRQRDFHREISRRVARHVAPEGLRPEAGKHVPPEGVARGAGNRPTSYPGRPAPEAPQAPPPKPDPPPIQSGDRLASLARKRRRQRET